MRSGKPFHLTGLADSGTSCELFDPCEQMQLVESDCKFFDLLLGGLYLPECKRA